MTAKVRHVLNSRQCSRVAKKLLMFSLFITLVGAPIWFSRELLLRQLGERWIISDDIRPADAAAIFGGFVKTRSLAGAEYYRRGLVKKILVANVRIGTGELSGASRPETAMITDALIKLGVSQTDIETFGSDLSNTYEEALALREWVVRNHANSVIVPTEAFSSRRVRWAVINAFAGTGATVQVDALNHPAYSHAEWWKSHAGFMSFQHELIKYFYYRLKY